MRNPKDLTANYNRSAKALTLASVPASVPVTGSVLVVLIIVLLISKGSGVM